jgi:ubiquinone biosynthesis protein UbiJ
MIILGIDAETSKWRPWDNYAAKEKHNCSARAASITNDKIATSATAGNGAAKSEEVAIVHARVTDLKTAVDMLTWMVEKLCNKMGVILDEASTELK